MRTLTLEIKREECVGDSIAKHNYNLLSLDTTVCNLSSDIYKKNNILTWFNDISANSTIYNKMALDFSNDAVEKYNINHTSISTLSSYWHTSDFTVQYEHNNYNSDSFNNASDGSIVNAYTLSTTIDTIQTNSLNYLNTNFPPTNYNIGSMVNVVVFIYNVLLDKSTNNNSSICYIPTEPSTSLNVGSGANASNILADARIDDYTVHYTYTSSPNPLGGDNNSISILTPSGSTYITNNANIRTAAASPTSPSYNIRYLSETFTSSGSWTVPAGVSSVTVFAVGGGGSGGSYNANGGYAGGGGGGGISSGKVDVTPGSVINYTVGAGGIGSISSSGATGAGGNTTFGNIIAYGGQAGTGSANGGGGIPGTGNYATGGVGGGDQRDGAAGPIYDGTQYSGGGGGRISGRGGLGGGGDHNVSGFFYGAGGGGSDDVRTTGGVIGNGYSGLLVISYAVYTATSVTIASNATTTAPAPASYAAGSSYYRTILVDFTHQEMQVAKVYTLKYIQQNNTWIYTGATISN